MDKFEKNHGSRVIKNTLWIFYFKKIIQFISFNFYNSNFSKIRYVQNYE